MPDRPPCPCCGASTIEAVRGLAPVPVHSVTIHHSAEEARSVASGKIALSFCHRCGFLFNAAFDATLQDYSRGYVSTQAHSGVFDVFHHRLARDLVERHQLRGGRIVEIGCGQGEFLRLLCEIADADGVGFDPAYVPKPEPTPRLRFVPEPYSGGHPLATADLVCCKMTLEHISRTAEFIGQVRRAMGERGIVFFQVPDVTRILDEVAFWDVYYEHCSYFDAGSLAHLFERSGFEVLRVWSDYGGQYLMIEARPSPPAAGAPPSHRRELAWQVHDFAEALPGRLSGWRDDLSRRLRLGERTALWGGGSKAVAFLTTLKLRDEIGLVVDINAEKHGTFLPGTGHPVAAPEALRAFRPDRVVVMNPLYRGEVADLLASLGIATEVVAVTEALANPRQRGVA